MEYDDDSAWAEIQQRADLLEQSFLRILEPETDSQYWREFQNFKRELHTLKGVCGLSGLGEAAQQIHALESLVKATSETETEPSKITEQLENPLRCLLNCLRSPKKVSEPERINQVFSESLNQDQKRQLQALALEGTAVLHLCYSQNDSKKPLKDLRAQLEAQTQILIAVPKVEGSQILFHLLVVDYPGLPELVNEFHLRCEPYSPEPTESSEPPTPTTPAPSGKSVSEVRLQNHKIEDLHRCCSELLTKFWRIKEAEALRGPNWEQFEGVLKELQAKVLSTRLVRLETLFGRFPLELRRVANNLGKPIRLQTIGDQLELDRDVVQGLAEPLRHLLVNAIVHGIEAPEVRDQSSKGSEGLVTLEATMSGAFLTLKISDDGQGIDRHQLSQRCGRNLDDDQDVLEQLCQPGWSSRAQSDLTSGRGLGMDIVQKSLTGLRGSLELKSESGQGTTFILTLPTSLTILSILEVNFGEMTLAFARDSISRVIDLDEVVQGGTSDQILCEIDGAPVPLFDVGKTLGLASGKTSCQTGLLCRGLTGLVVFRVPAPAGIRDIVLQPCDSPFLDKEWLDGVTTLGSGKTAFLVSIPGFIERARQVD